MKIDMVGKVFGLLTVIELDEERMSKHRKERNAGLRNSGSLFYICKCKCGNTVSVNGQKLRIPDWGKNNLKLIIENYIKEITVND